MNNTTKSWSKVALPPKNYPVWSIYKSQLSLRGKLWFQRLSWPANIPVSIENCYDLIILKAKMLGKDIWVILYYIFNMPPIVVIWLGSVANTQTHKPKIKLFNRFESVKDCVPNHLVIEALISCYEKTNVFKNQTGYWTSEN